MTAHKARAAAIAFGIGFGVFRILRSTAASERPWRTIGAAFLVGASIGFHRSSAAILKNIAVLADEWLAAGPANRAQSWIDQSERLPARA